MATSYNGPYTPVSRDPSQDKAVIGYHVGAQRAGEDFGLGMAGTTPVLCYGQ